VRSLQALIATWLNYQLLEAQVCTSCVCLQAVFVCRLCLTINHQPNHRPSAGGYLLLIALLVCGAVAAPTRTTTAVRLGHVRAAVHLDARNNAAGEVSSLQVTLQLASGSHPAAAPYLVSLAIRLNPILTGGVHV
jgi:hypothetical protein